MLTLQIPDELAQPYEDLARAAGRDKADYMLDALCAYLEEMEDRRIVVERRMNPEASLSLEEVKRNLGLEA